MLEELEEGVVSPGERSVEVSVLSLCRSTRHLFQLNLTHPPSLPLSLLARPRLLEEGTTSTNAYIEGFELGTSFTGN